VTSRETRARVSCAPIDVYNGDSGEILSVAPYVFMYAAQGS